MSKSFVPEKVLSNTNAITSANSENVPFGVVKLDDQGYIQIYNKYNYEQFADFKQSVIGKNYFTEVAPCANNFMFSGRFKRGVEQNQLNTVFDYVFTYKLKPTKVQIHLFRDEHGNNWIFVIKK